MKEATKKPKTKKEGKNLQINDAPTAADLTYANQLEAQAFELLERVKKLRTGKVKVSMNLKLS
jgi:hypothetical protein